MIQPLEGWTLRLSRTCWSTFLVRSCSIVCTPRSGRVRRSWHTPVSGPWRVMRRESQPRQSALEKGEGKDLSLLQQKALATPGTSLCIAHLIGKGAYYATDYPVRPRGTFLQRLNENAGFL